MGKRGGGGGRDKFSFTTCLHICILKVNWDFDSSQHPVCDEILRQPSLEQWMEAWKLGKAKKVMKSV